MNDDPESIDSLVGWLMDLSERLEGMQDEIDYVVDNIGALIAADAEESIPEEREAALDSMRAITLPFLATHLPDLGLIEIQELVRVEQWEGRQADLKYHHLWYAAAVCAAKAGPVFASVEREEADGELIVLQKDYWAADCLGRQDGA